MKAYVIVTGIAFAAIAVVHLLRLSAEGMQPIHEPSFIVSSLLSVALTIWSATLIVRGRRS